MAIVNELVTILDMSLSDGASKAVTFIDNSISTIADKMDRLGRVATAMVAGIGASMGAYAKDAREINQLSIETGNSVEDIQSLGYAFESLGADADDARGVLKSLNDSMYSVTEGEANEALLRMGITIFDNNNKLKNSSQLFMEISDKLSTMASKGGVYARDAAKWGKELGLSGEALQVALQGTDKIRGLQKEAQSLGFVFSKDKLIAGQSYYEAMSKIKNIIKSLYTSVMADLVPELNKLTSKFQDWVKNSDNSKKILYGLNVIIKGLIGGFIKFGEVITKIAGFIDDVISKFGPFGTELKNTEIIAKLVALAMGVMAGSFVISTLSPLIKGISVFGGGLLKLLSSITGVIPAIWSFAMANAAALLQITLIVAGIAALVAAGVWLYKNWDKVTEFFKNSWESIKETTSKFTDSIIETIFSSWNGVKEFFENLWDGIGEVFKNGLDYVQPLIDKIVKFTDTFKSGWSWIKQKAGFGDNSAELISNIAATPVSGVSNINNTSNNSQNTSTDVTNNTTFNINVSGGSDPMKTARAIRGAMESYANEVNGG